MNKARPPAITFGELICTSPCIACGASPHMKEKHRQEAEPCSLERSSAEHHEMNSRNTKRSREELKFVKGRQNGYRSILVVSIR